jgi:hypothetical protein
MRTSRIVQLRPVICGCSVMAEFEDASHYWLDDLTGLPISPDAEAILPALRSDRGRLPRQRSRSRRDAGGSSTIPSPAVRCPEPMTWRRGYLTAEGKRFRVTFCDGGRWG